MALRRDENHVRAGMIQVKGKGDGLRVLLDERGVDQTARPNAATSRRAETGTAEPKSTFATGLPTCAVPTDNSGGGT